MKSDDQANIDKYYRISYFIKILESLFQNEYEYEDKAIKYFM